MVNPFKVSASTFFVLLGIIVMGNFDNDFRSIIGSISMAIGLGIMAWVFSDEKN